jgi:hypothetical protein
LRPVGHSQPISTEQSGSVVVSSVSLKRVPSRSCRLIGLSTSFTTIAYHYRVERPSSTRSRFPFPRSPQIGQRVALTKRTHHAVASAVLNILQPTKAPQQRQRIDNISQESATHPRTAEPNPTAPTDSSGSVLTDSSTMNDASPRPAPKKLKTNATTFHPWFVLLSHGCSSSCIHGGFCLVSIVAHS